MTPIDEEMQDLPQESRAESDSPKDSTVQLSGTAAKLRDAMLTIDQEMEDLLQKPRTESDTPSDPTARISGINAELQATMIRIDEAMEDLEKKFSMCRTESDSPKDPMVQLSDITAKLRDAMITIDQEMEDLPQESRAESDSPEDPTVQLSGAMSPSIGTEQQDLKICILEERADELFRSSKYEEAFGVLKTIRSTQPDNLKTLMRTAECLLLMDDFDDAFTLVVKKIEPMILKEPRPDPKAFIEESQRCHQDEMFLRSSITIWLACTLYRVQSATRESLEGILECMRNMEELLVNVYKKHGIFTEDFHSKRFSECKRFGDFYIRSLYSLQKKLKKPEDPELESLFAKVQLGCTTALASCFVILEDFEASLRFFKEYYDSVVKDADGPRDLKFCFGRFVADFSFSLQQLIDVEELEFRANNISDARQNVADYKETGEKDDLLKKEMLRSIDEVAATTENIQRTVRDMICKLVTTFIKS